MCTRGLKGWAIPVLIGAALMTVPILASAATYYVDAAGGNDGNAGVSQSAAWQSIPGTCKADNSGFRQASGWTKIKAGDTIVVKGGSAFGARLVIDENWYENGTPDSPIRIIRDPSWGSGPVVFDGGGVTQGTWDAIIHVTRVNHLHIDGGEPGGIIIKNARSRGFNATGKSESEKMAGLILRNVKLFNNGGFNVVLQRQDSFLVENVEADGNRNSGTGGFYIGDNTYGCSNGRLRNCISYNNGANPGAQAGGTDGRIGFWVTNSTNILLEGCVAHDNEGDGFDAGSVGAPPSTVTDNIVFLNCLAYNNADGFGCNLDDVPGEARFWFINCISRNNNNGWDIYQGPTAFLYNCLSAKNGNGLYMDSVGFARQTVVTMKNTIMFGNIANTVYLHDGRSLRFYADYNVYDQAGGGNSLIRWYDAPGGENQFCLYGYSGTPNLATWKADRGQDVHSGDSVEGKAARFVASDSNNYHLSGDSSAKGNGINLSGEWPQGIPTADRNGLARPDGAWDVGPYVASSGPTQSMSDIQEFSFSAAHALAAPVPVAATNSEGATDGGGGGGGGCFIATAAFGSYLAPQVETLRDFRDRYLVKTEMGRKFVSFYYRVSPPVAGYIAEHGELRAATRWALTPIVILIAYPGYAVASLLLLSSAGIWLSIMKKRSALEKKC